MQQTYTFTSLVTANSRDSAHAVDRVDPFEAAMTELRNVGIEFVILAEAEPIEQAA